MSAENLVGMSEERYKALMEDDNLELTPEEIEAGWHFCYDFDGLLVGPGMGEQMFCLCLVPTMNIQKLIARWRKDADAYQRQVEEARKYSVPHEQMLSGMSFLRQCAKELEHVIRHRDKPTPKP